MARTEEFFDILGDVFDIRDVIARYEELESDRETLVEVLACAEEDGPEAILPNGERCRWDERLRISGAAEVPSSAEDDARYELNAWDAGNAGSEFAQIEEFLDEVKGYGGDEQWRGDWYPLLFISDSYFTKYTQELLEDCGDLPRGMPSYVVIDWEATARNIRADYSSVEIDDVTYWYR